MNIKGFRRALLNWYKKNKRDLPWRSTSDPYKIWVSEVLLQQTQVSTVIPYYEDFVREFPGVKCLSDAPLDRVLKVCEGAGYYGRIRNLKKAADVVLKKYGGKIPECVEELREIPGIGDYTAAAVSSIAFHKPEPVLDGNVKRVLSRVFCITSEISKSSTQKELIKKARELMDESDPSSFNQSMMELGALVCVPKNPKCGVCPVALFCEAAVKNLQNQLPVKQKKKAVPHHVCVVGIICKNGRILIAKRKPDGFLGGLWEFPGGKKEKNETITQCLHREIKEEVSLKIKVRKRLPAVNHAYSHFCVTLHPFLCEWISGKVKPVSCEETRWILQHDLKKYAFPSANKKIFASLEI